MSMKLTLNNYIRFSENAKIHLSIYFENAKIGFLSYK